MNKEKRKVGRPRFEVTPEVCEQVENLAAQGLTVDQIALVLGVSHWTIYERQNEFPEFSDALKKGRAKGLEKVTNKLFENATVKGDNLAIFYYLNNRDRSNWANRNEVTATVEQQHVIDLTRIPDDQLESIEASFSRINSGASESGEVPQIIEGVHEG